MDVRRLYENIDFHPHPGQERFLIAAGKYRFCVVCAGRRWGKSRSGPHHMIPKMLMKKPTMGWIVAPTYDLGEKEFRVFWEVLIDKLQLPVNKSKTFNSLRTKDFRITTAWGSSVEVRSAEHPESLVGEGLDWVIMAEAAKLKLSHWEKYIRPTLSDKRGQAVFVSTPEGFNWFYDMYQRGQKKSEFWWSMRSPTWENTAVFSGADDPEMREVEDTLSREVFDQEYGALFTSFAGRIYSEFDEGYHVIDDYKFHNDWPNYIAFDFGFRNPFVCLQIQVAPNDDIFVWDEYYQRNITTPQHARNLKDIIKWRVDGGFYDPSGPDEAGAITAVFRDTSLYNNPHLSNVTLSPAPNEWKPGVERVKEWLKLRDNGFGKLAPKLFVTRNCTETLREFNTYRVREQSERITELKDPKDEPRKKDDHAMDALRYFITGQFGYASHIARTY